VAQATQLTASLPSLSSPSCQFSQLLLDGRNVKVPGYPNGNWMGPTILSKVTTDMDCYKEEIFGPVMTCLEVETLDEVTLESGPVCISTLNKKNIFFLTNCSPHRRPFPAGHCVGECQPLG
jgi:hypothetical protein